jgi:hypothetical protein
VKVCLRKTLRMLGGKGPKTPTGIPSAGEKKAVLAENSLRTKIRTGAEAKSEQ